MGWYRKVARSVCSLLERGPGGQTCRALSFLGTWQKSDALGLHPGLSGGGTRRSPPISKAKGSQHNSLCDQWEWRVLDRTIPLSPSFQGPQISQESASMASKRSRGQISPAPPYRIRAENRRRSNRGHGSLASGCCNRGLPGKRQVRVLGMRPISNARVAQFNRAFAF